MAPNSPTDEPPLETPEAVDTVTVAARVHLEAAEGLVWPNAGAAAVVLPT